MSWTLFWQLFALAILLYIIVWTLIGRYYDEKTMSIILTETQVTRILQENQMKLPQVPDGPAPGAPDTREELFRL